MYKTMKQKIVARVERCVAQEEEVEVDVELKSCTGCRATAPVEVTDCKRRVWPTPDSMYASGWMDPNEWLIGRIRHGDEVEAVCLCPECAAMALAEVSRQER